MSRQGGWDERLREAESKGLSLTDQCDLGNFSFCLVGEGLKEAGVGFESRGFYILVNGEPELQLSIMGHGFSREKLDLETLKALAGLAGTPMNRWVRGGEIKKLKAQKAKIDRYIREHYPKQVWTPQDTIMADTPTVEPIKVKETV